MGADRAERLGEARYFFLAFFFVAFFFIVSPPFRSPRVHAVAHVGLYGAVQEGVKDKIPYGGEICLAEPYILGPVVRRSRTAGRGDRPRDAIRLALERETACGARCA